MNWEAGAADAIGGGSFQFTVQASVAAATMVDAPAAAEDERSSGSSRPAALAGAYRSTQPDPVPATAASLASGQQVYGANCASCHGATGRGDGPAGFALRPRPADFPVHMAAGHTDAQLYNWVQDGVDGTALPAFGNTLTSEQIWDVINYIRTFAPETSGAGG